MIETIKDSYLGIIKYDDEYDRYEGKVTTNDGEVIEFSFDIEEDLQEVLKGTREIIKNYCDRTLEFKLHIAEELLDLYNNTWSEDEIIDNNEFIQRIALDSISFSSDLSAEFYYLDGDLFAGHFIVIDMDSEGQLGDAYLAG